MTFSAKRRWQVGFLSWLAVVNVSAAAAITLSAGAARADITPDPRMANWVTMRPYGDVMDPLFVRAWVLSDGTTKVVYVGWDLLDAREYAVARVRRAIAQALQVPELHIMVQATHTHSGPKSEMGAGERTLPREQKASTPAQQDPLYRPWADKLVETCMQVARKADAAREPVTLWLGRGYVGEWLFNRRPLKPDGTVQSMLAPADPYALGGGLRFGAVDPTVTVLAWRTPQGQAVATFFHLSLHAVSLYGGYRGLSADWPGATTERLRSTVGGEPIFLQGCAGDIVPFRRGPEATAAMAEGMAKRIVEAGKRAVQLPAARLRVSSATLGLPATKVAADALGRATVEAEVQVVTCGGLALVTLPGEPLTDLGQAIQARSPFPHTLVLGYANGRGAGYIAMPDNKWRGGYEMTEVGAATDEAGQSLVETAVRLLKEHAASK